MNNITNTDFSEISLNSSTISFQKVYLQNRENQSPRNNSNLSTQTSINVSAQDMNNITLKGECIIDLNYFQYFKQTYKPQIHPINNFLNVISTQKNKHFVELRIQNAQTKFLSNDAIYSSLQSVCPTKVEKATKLFDFLTQDETFKKTCENDTNISSLPLQSSLNCESIQNEAFERAAFYLNQRTNKLYKFNIYCKTEDNQISYLKHGVSNLTLSALKMSADFYQYVHMRFGVSPFVDKYYSKNFFEVNQELLEQSFLQNNDQFQTKYVMNLSSVGAIYTQTECEILDLNNGFFLEIQYSPNENILSSQVAEINIKLRIQTKEYNYSQASSNFINKYYPDTKIWKQSKIQEVDSDIVEKLIKKRDFTQRSNVEQKQYSQGMIECSSKSNSSPAQSVSFIY